MSRELDAPMNATNVIPFRNPRPADIELETYHRMTRSWHPDVKKMMFPEHFKREQQAERRRAAR